MIRNWLAVVAVMLLSITGATAQMRPGAHPVLQACRPDIARLCSQVSPGQGRIKACMKEHAHELSGPCKEAIIQARQRQARQPNPASAH